MIDIQNEMKALKLNVEYNIKKYCRNNFHLNYFEVFREENWLLTFPFNFIGQFETDRDLIRKIAVINCLYIGTFLKEDFISGNLRIEDDKSCTDARTYCYVKLLNILAIRQYVYQCGEIILKYLFMYEETYYSSLFKEKNFNAVCVNEACIPESLNIIGQKLLPLVTSFAGYCILKDKESLIPKCEELIVDYQIAKQLFKDINVIKEGLFNGNRSHLIKQVSGINKIRNAAYVEMDEPIPGINTDILIIKNIQKYLNDAVKLADELKFDLIKHEILMMKETVAAYENN